ncbi:MAG: prolipoprotein diacylglyceryl transferase [Acidithiobacillales bacterium SM23_46]|jgi:phosphatidylglycerol:prolipoprotein diacylglycerol transferase|nr:MAG: prolipoprotein diacylglyceryl transferase [Acidithiobacillales bacterium SM23_46]KPL28910.1 MAG: prolipoprotein diacylglyceryl transferase [Acidithiobacillales bacterium SM1_46]
MLAPEIDPIAIHLGPLKIHWYGLMYLVGFLGGWWVGVYRAKRPGSGWDPKEVSDYLFYIALGVILGGRFGYVLFYNLAHYLKHPLDIFAIWSGGMSFHGGLIGVCVAMWLYGRKTKRPFLAVTDFVAVLTPIGLGPGRIGNFINQELWGRVTDLPWGMVFRTGGPLPRHPTQLYEATLEGLVLFLILWFYSRSPRPVGAVSSLFLIFYGLFRFLVELVREPDPQLGYLAFGWVTMGQVLSLPMILLGAWMLWWSHQRARVA